MNCFNNLFGEIVGKVETLTRCVENSTLTAEEKEDRQLELQRHLVSFTNQFKEIETKIGGLPEVEFGEIDLAARLFYFGATPYLPLFKIGGHSKTAWDLYHVVERWFEDKLKSIFERVRKSDVSVPDISWRLGHDFERVFEWLKDLEGFHYDRIYCYEKREEKDTRLTLAESMQVEAINRRLAQNQQVIRGKPREYHGGVGQNTVAGATPGLRRYSR